MSAPELANAQVKADELMRNELESRGWHDRLSRSDSESRHQFDNLWHARIM